MAGRSPQPQSGPQGAEIIFGHDPRTILSPDPTLLTTQSLQREIAVLKELIQVQFDSFDAAIKQTNEGFARFPARMDEHVQYLRELTDSRFAELNARLNRAATEREDKFKIITDNLELRITASESANDKALDKYGSASQARLDKAEKQLQDALDRAQQELRTALADNEKRTNEKFDLKDKGMDRFQLQIDRMTIVIDEKVHGLENLHNEKFCSIDNQFGSIESSVQSRFLERDVRTDKLADAGADALAAALLAAKEAVAVAFQAAKEAAALQTQASERAIQKSELATNKQLDQIGELFRTAAETNAGKFEDMKDRISIQDARLNTLLSSHDARFAALEGRTAGGDRFESRAGQQWAFLFGAVGCVIGIGGAVAGFVTLMQHLK